MDLTSLDMQFPQAGFEFGILLVNIPASLLILYKMIMVEIKLKWN